MSRSIVVDLGAAAGPLITKGRGLFSVEMSWYQN